MAPSDAGAVLRIYQAGLDSGLASYETVVRLHARARFQVIGVRHHPGRHQRPGGRWRDVVLIERRSPVVYPS
jgi:phosphinothricin acetyltransferase